MTFSDVENYIIWQHELVNIKNTQNVIENDISKLFPEIYNKAMDYLFKKEKELQIKLDELIKDNPRVYKFTEDYRLTFDRYKELQKHFGIKYLLNNKRSILDTWVKEYQKGNREIILEEV